MASGTKKVAITAGLLLALRSACATRSAAARPRPRHRRRRLDGLVLHQNQKDIIKKVGAYKANHRRPREALHRHPDRLARRQVPAHQSQPHDRWADENSSSRKSTKRDGPRARHVAVACEQRGKRGPGRPGGSDPGSVPASTGAAPRDARPLAAPPPDGAGARAPAQSTDRRRTVSLLDVRVEGLSDDVKDNFRRQLEGLIDTKRYCSPTAPT